ncbi:MAG: cation transporter [Proteobacteria bacterium]|nr:cation transporter [Pseudomonadota bacterium]
MSAEKAASPFRQMKMEPEHWTDSKEMQRVMHSLPGLFRAVLLEMLDRPLSRHEIRDFISHMDLGVRASDRLGKAHLELEAHLSRAIELEVLEEREGLYHLTAGGREMAEYMERVIPVFMKWAYSPETVTSLTIWVHVVLSVVKLGVGVLSRSAGLISDGIDNAVDTVSSLLVWLGIKYDRVRLASVFMTVAMFGSVGAVALAAADKFIHPEPVREGALAIGVSLACGLVMLGLSSYQYVVGRRASNLAVMCQAVDSRNHFLTSLLVGTGIAFSFLDQLWHTVWLYYADAAASVVIGLLILRSAVELFQELFRPADEEADVSHFMKKAMERRQEAILFDWLKGQLHSRSMTTEELESRFAEDFRARPPRAVLLSGMGFHPESEAILHEYLDRFVEKKKVVRDQGRYWWIAGS